MSASTIYAEHLLQTQHGYALWHPDPHGGLAVEVADVGYVENGAFVRLFNASKPHGDRSNNLGVPPDYRPLKVGVIQERTFSTKGPIMSRNVSQLGAEVNLSGGAVVQGGGGFSFQCSKEKGAVLILGDDADIQDALHKKALQRYIRENHAAWLTFANDVHERGIALNDLVLVTGFHKTSAWACAAFSTCTSSVGLQFQIGYPGAVQSDFSIWGFWENRHAVEAHSGPRTPVPKTQPLPLLESYEDEAKKCDDDPSTFDTQGNEAKESAGETLLAKAKPQLSVGQYLDVWLIQCSFLLAMLLLRTLFQFFHLIPPQYESAGRTGNGIQNVRQSEPEFPEDLRVDPNSQKDKTSMQAEELESSTQIETLTATLRTSTAHPLQTHSPAPRNQCVFLRGYRMCDKKTWRALRLWREKQPIYDGFTHVPHKSKGEKDAPPGASRPWDPLHPSGNSKGPQPSDKELEPHTLGSTEKNIDKSLDLFMHLNNKERTPFDIVLGYILETTKAELALVHDEDIITLLKQNDGCLEDFEDWIFKAAPKVLFQNKVGMLETTYIDSPQKNIKYANGGSHKVEPPPEIDSGSLGGPVHPLRKPPPKVYLCKPINMCSPNTGYFLDGPWGNELPDFLYMSETPPQPPMVLAAC